MHLTSERSHRAGQERNRGRFRVSLRGIFPAEAAALDLDSDIFNGAGESNADRAVVPSGEKELLAQISRSKQRQYLYLERPDILGQGGLHQPIP